MKNGTPIDLNIQVNCNTFKLMKTLLVLTDFSSSAFNAAKYVAQLSQDLKADRILIYHSSYLDNPEMILVTEIAVLAPGVDSKTEQEIIHKLENLKQELQAFAEARIVVETITNELPLLDGIKEIIKKENVDMVVAGMSGAGDKGNNSVGKNTASLMKNRNFPFLIIPANATYNGIKVSLLACDLKHTTDTLPADEIKAFISQTGSKLFIVNVEHEETLGAASYLTEEGALHNLFDNLNPEFHYLNQENIIEGIMDFARNQQANLIIAVPKKRGFLENLFHESATKKLAVNTQVPLLLFHHK